ncbi:hypothetical protein MATL_G00040760 [Megalops atlanticus]|uniref:LRRNT domain-containing protein n=1 Tax=Megalops atlanticus TaxID=7932 RepID=A0A9D3QD52_MEGAT|nr:hypothetical protein MATL_G00040760 [Megalops atlanticus]
MKTTRKAVTMSPWGQLSCALLLLLFWARVLAICPPMCTCTRSHRVVDCSGRGLSQLPDSLQHNIRTLNLSHNRLQDLDGLLSHFAHLRTLDVSHNRLSRLPPDLPRALWELLASGNRLRLLDKNHTAYQWNLRALDLSANELERVVFINNTLPALRFLNLSHNRFWTVPTNMPHNLETVDLSHNFLVQILPGSLDRLHRLARFYLHGNRFAVVSERAFERLDGLQLVTLDDNPWACEDEENITGLLAWMHQTPARVQGCPCHTRRVCGEARPAPTGGWHFASYTQAPLGTYARDVGRLPARSVTSGYLSEPAPPNLPRGRSDPDPDSAPLDGAVPDDNGTFPSVPAGHLLFERGFTTVGTTTSTTPRSRSVKKAKTEGARSTNPGPRACAPDTALLNLLLTTAVLQVF